jgi:hypothetical protein
MTQKSDKMTDKEITQLGLPFDAKYNFEVDSKYFEKEQFDIEMKIFTFLVEDTGFGFFAKETLNGLYDRINRFCPKKDQILIESCGNDNYRLTYKKYTREKYFELIKDTLVKEGFIMTETISHLYERINEFCPKEKQVSIDLMADGSYRLIYKIT